MRLLLAFSALASAESDFDQLLTVLASAVSGAINGDSLSAMRSQYLFDEVRHTLMNDTPSRECAEKFAMLREMSKKLEGLIGSSKPAGSRGAIVMVSHAIYSPRRISQLVDLLKESSSPGEKRMAVLAESPALRERWAKKVYNIDMSNIELAYDKLTIVNDILSGNGDWADKEDALGSLSVWALQLYETDLAVEVNQMIDRHANLFLKQRQLLGLPSNPYFDLKNFRKVDRDSSKLFKAVYTDAEVSQLVRSLSGIVAYRTVASELVEAGRAEFTEFSKKRADLDRAMLEKLLSRGAQDPKMAEAVRPESEDEASPLIGKVPSIESSDSEKLEWVLSVRDFAFSPLITNHCLELLSSLKASATFGTQAMVLIAEYQDSAALKKKQRDHLSLAGIIGKLWKLTRIVDVRFEKDHTFDIVTIAILGNIAAWFTKLLKTETTAGRQAPFAAAKLILANMTWAFRLLRRKLFFKFETGAGLSEQVRAFSQAYGLGRDYIAMCYSVDEAESIWKVAVYISVLEGLQRQGIPYSGVSIDIVQKALDL